MTQDATGRPAGGSAVVLVDARGLRCPLPVIRLAAAALPAPAGTEVRLLSTDPAAPSDVAAWCRLRGHEHLATTAGPDGVQISRVRLGARVRAEERPAAPPGGGPGSPPG